MPVFFKLSIEGEDNFPEHGPLLVIGNHVAVMESVMMTVYTPYMLEMVSSKDIPHEKMSDLSNRFYGSISFNRGHIQRESLNQCLDVLKQKGVLGIFPEGGIWSQGQMQARTGVSWLSYKSQAPVLPIFFGGSKGALGKALRLQRPELTMTIGDLIPPANPTAGTPRKQYLQEYAEKVMQAVKNLDPEQENSNDRPEIDVDYELRIAISRANGEPIAIPGNLVMTHGNSVASLLHMPGILKIFYVNLKLPVGPLLDVKSCSDPEALKTAADSIIGYLSNQNPYMLSYRLGAAEAEKVSWGLSELGDLSQWAAGQGYNLTLTPIRRYKIAGDPSLHETTEQGDFRDWM
jgi:1-acyl-sn-glycerol-3-phosphate acyltransferase